MRKTQETAFKVSIHINNEVTTENSDPVDPTATVTFQSTAGHIIFVLFLCQWLT